MAHFIAYQAVNMTTLMPGWDFLYTEPVSFIHTSGEVAVENADHSIVIVLKSVAGHPFTYKMSGPYHLLAGGVIGSLEVDYNGSIAYKFTGLSAPVLGVGASTHNIAAVLNLFLAGNDKITGSPFDDVLTGAHGNAIMTGGGGNDTFVFPKGFGKDVITDFHHGDTIAISHKIFPNFEAVQDAAHVDAHHHVVITVNAHESITLNTVHHVSDLTASEFLFV